MKEVIVSLILFAVIGAGDLLYTYKNSVSVFSDTKKYDEYEDDADSYSYERAKESRHSPKARPIM